MAGTKQVPKLPMMPVMIKKTVIWGMMVAVILAAQVKTQKALLDFLLVGDFLQPIDRTQETAMRHGCVRSAVCVP